MLQGPVLETGDLSETSKPISAVVKLGIQCMDSVTFSPICARSTLRLYMLDQTISGKRLQVVQPLLQDLQHTYHQSRIHSRAMAINFQHPVTCATVLARGPRNIGALMP